MKPFPALPLALLALTIPAALSAQVYRGFAAGAAYREFADRARVLASGDPLVCNTSRRTAQLMECGLMIRDPSDSASFYLSAYVLEGRVALVSFGDSGGPALVDRTRRDLTARFGPGKKTGHSTIEWTYGRRLVRFSWRGRGSARWIYVTLSDHDVMDRIASYVQRKR
jgi:hypothetical protein